MVLPLNPHKLGLGADFKVVFAPSHSIQDTKHLSYQISGPESEYLPDGTSTLTTISESEEIFLAQPKPHAWEDEEEDGRRLEAAKTSEDNSPKTDKVDPSVNVDSSAKVDSSQDKEWKEVDGQWVYVAKKSEEKEAVKPQEVAKTTSTTALETTTTKSRSIPTPQPPPNKPPIIDRFEHMSGGTYLPLITFLTVVRNTPLQIDRTFTLTVSIFALA